MSIARNRRDVDRELERRITAVKALDSSRYKSIRTLHFEGISDYYFVKEFCQNHPRLKIDKPQFFAYSNGKEKAIKSHKIAIGLGFKISTIVDLDHDFKDHDISKKISKGSRNEYIKQPNIRSTNPGCTLLTLLLLDEGRMEEAIKRIPLLNQPSADRIRLILNHATERTSKRMRPRFWANEKRLKKWKEDFQKKIPNPMNDHSLCESIYLHRNGVFLEEEEEGWLWAQLDKNSETKKAIEKSVKDSAKKLGSKTLENIVDSMWTETETTFG